MTACLFRFFVDADYVEVLGVTKADWTKGEMVDMSRGKWDQLTLEEMAAACPSWP